MNEYLSVGIVIVLAIGFLGILVNTFKTGSDELENLK